MWAGTCLPHDFTQLQEKEQPQAVVTKHRTLRNSTSKLHYYNPRSINLNLISLPVMPSANPDLIPHFAPPSDPEKLSNYDIPLTPFLNETERTSDYGFQLSQRQQTFGGGSKEHLNTTRVRTGRKQELQHDFRYLSTIGFTTLVMGT